VRLGARVAERGFVHIADVPVEETWAQLKADPKAVLIDVRTKAEWAFVGVPDLSALGRRVVMVEWQSFPESRVDGDFSGRVAAALAAAGSSKDDALFFICRSGGRSRMAAEAMAEAGYRHCVNVAEGFEGPLDDRRHRGGIAGWKASGLPWVQG
jgi:rhodanese-related sulfurtransferase